MARYGREQRGRAVDLYVRYERCAADVIRELGHPGKGALLSWYADRLEEERTRGGGVQEEAPRRPGRGKPAWRLWRRETCRRPHPGLGTRRIRWTRWRPWRPDSRACRPVWTNWTPMSNGSGGRRRSRTSRSRSGRARWSCWEKSQAQTRKTRPATRRRSSSNRPVRSSA